MSARFDDMAAERDALYQTLRPEGEFAAAWQDDRLAAKRERSGDSAEAYHHRMFRDASLLRLAIRALKARQEVEPGDN